MKKLPVKQGIIALVLLLVAAAVFVYLRRAPRREGAGTLRISGNVELTEVQVSFKVPGRVLSRSVDEGALVKRGETVARLEDAELQDALSLARADAEAAAATLAATRKAAISVPLIPGLKALKARHTGDATWNNIRPPHLKLTAEQQATLFAAFDASGATLAKAA